MEKLIQIKSIAAPLILPNIDTDIITPMKRILFNPDQLAKYAFEPFRFINGDGDSGILDPSFILNQEAYRDAKIMIVGDNFGCGSSRETAPEAIAGMGIRCLIGTSFGGIFFKNCFQQGILPIVFSPETIKDLVSQVDIGEFSIDLYNRRITTPKGNMISFQIGETQRYLLLNGLDNVGLTLKKREKIHEFEQADVVKRPWVYRSGLKMKD